MSNLVLGLKNKKTNVRIEADISKAIDVDAIIPTALGLYVFHTNEDFTDILKVTNLYRRESGSWVKYYIETYTYDNRKYRYKRNRNLYNKKDEPIVVEVGGM